MPVEKSQNLLKRAMRQTASYNSHINRQRREDFSVYYDMSTNVGICMAVLEDMTKSDIYFIRRNTLKRVTGQQSIFLA